MQEITNQKFKAIEKQLEEEVLNAKLDLLLDDYGLFYFNYSVQNDEKIIMECRLFDGIKYEVLLDDQGELAIYNVDLFEVGEDEEVGEPKKLTIDEFADNLVAHIIKWSSNLGFKRQKETFEWRELQFTKVDQSVEPILEKYRLSHPEFQFHSNVSGAGLAISVIQNERTLKQMLLSGKSLYDMVLIEEEKAKAIHKDFRDNKMGASVKKMESMVMDFEEVLEHLDKRIDAILKGIESKPTISPTITPPAGSTGTGTNNIS